MTRSSKDDELFSALPEPSSPPSGIDRRAFLVRNAAIGAAAGATGGYIWDQHKQAEERAYQRGVQEGKSSAPTSQ